MRAFKKNIDVFKKKKKYETFKRVNRVFIRDVHDEIRNHDGHAGGDLEEFLANWFKAVPAVKCRAR